MQEAAATPIFREMTLDDLARVLEIEKGSFPTPWSQGAFISELKENRYAHYVVAEVDGTVTAYAGMWLILDEGHITNIAVHPDWRGRGIGDLLLTEMENRARARGMRAVTLEVRVSNDVAQNLYRKHHFMPTGIRKAYYTDNGEDALIMWKELDGGHQRTTSPRQRVKRSLSGRKPQGGPVW